MIQDLGTWLDNLINTLYPNEDFSYTNIQYLPDDFATLYLITHVVRWGDIDFGNDPTATHIPTGYGAAIPTRDSEKLALNFPNATIIEKEAFYKSKVNITKVVDLSKVEIVEERAFKSRPWQNDIILPNVISIKEDAFYSCYTEGNDWQHGGSTHNIHIPKCQFLGKNALGQGGSLAMTINLYLNEYDGVCQLENENALKLGSNKTNPVVSTLNVYVPENQVQNYLADEKWSKAISKYAESGSEGREKGRIETINILPYSNQR